MAIFPQIYKKPSLNRFYWCLCYFGGIIYTDKIAGKYKKIWLILVSTTASIVLISNFAYMCTSDHIPIQDILFLFLPFNLTAAYLFTIAIVLFQIKNLQSGIADLDNIYQRYSQLFEHKTETNTARIEKYMVHFFLVLAFVVMWMSGVLRVLLAEKDIDLNDKTLYLYPFPNFIRVTSVAVYFGIVVIQFLTSLPCVSSVVLSFELYFVLSSELDDIMTGLRHYLHDQSKLTTEIIEASHRLELTTKAKKTTNAVRMAFIAQRKHMNHEFNQNIIYFIRIHQKMIKAVSQIIPSYQHGNILWLMFTPPIIVSMGNDILTAMKTEFGPEDVGRFAAGVAATVILYTVFSAARKIENACENLQDEVYATPWYLLSKQCRQNIFILMNQVQKPITLIVGFTFKLEMPLLLDILNKCYSYIMFIQTIVDKFKLK